MCYLFFSESSISSDLGESLSIKLVRWDESFSINDFFLKRVASSIISCTKEPCTSSDPFKVKTWSKISSSPVENIEKIGHYLGLVRAKVGHIMATTTLQSSLLPKTTYIFSSFLHLVWLATNRLIFKRPLILRYCSYSHLNRIIIWVIQFQK